MESNVARPAPSIAEKIARVATDVGAELVQGTETVTHEGAQGLMEGARVLGDASKTAAHDIERAGKDLAHGVHDSLNPVPAPPTTPVPAVALAATMTAPV